MTMYIYRTDGEPVGFQFSSFIHDLDGNPLGRIVGTHVHRLDGSYVGELFKDMVVDKPVPRRRDVAPVEAPPSLAGPGPSYRRRGIVAYGFRDVFHLLFEPGPGLLELEVPLALAAE
jgi:hypothetical protein